MNDPGERRLQSSQDGSCQDAWLNCVCEQGKERAPGSRCRRGRRRDFCWVGSGTPRCECSSNRSLPCLPALHPGLLDLVTRVLCYGYISLSWPAVLQSRTLATKIRLQGQNRTLKAWQSFMAAWRSNLHTECWQHGNDCEYWRQWVGNGQKKAMAAAGFRQRRVAPSSSRVYLMKSFLSTRMRMVARKPVSSTTVTQLLMMENQ